MASGFCRYIIEFRSKYKDINTIIFALLACLLLMLTTTGCRKIPDQIDKSWAYSDLLALDPVDTGSSELELLALYSRFSGHQVQIRLDLLNITPEQPIDLYVLFDTAPGGIDKTPIIHNEFQGIFDWEYMLRVSSISGAQLSDHFGNTLPDPGVKIVRDTFLDTIYISLPQNTFSLAPGSYNFLIIASSPEEPGIYDYLGPVESGAPPPTPVPVALAFWDVFQASTPSQALRSWDGAHTGPNSSRHGLRHLFLALEQYHLPVFVSGLHNKSVYPALEYLGVTGQVLSLLDYGLVLDGSYFDCSNGYAQFNYVDNTFSATARGLAPSTIVEILNFTLAEHQIPILLAGSFQNSSWGLPEAVAPTLAYIAAHPWIQLLNQYDLAQMTHSPDLSVCSVADPDIDFKILERFSNIEPNALSKLAWDSYTDLLADCAANSKPLCENYLPQVGHILAAAVWANSPTIIADCSTDLDWDGAAECVLANDKLFTSFELHGGYLAFAFYMNEDGPHQILGPSYQLSLGLSDPSSWNAQNGLLADPAQIIGAFIDPAAPLQGYSSTILPGKLQLVSTDMAMRKSVTINDSSIFFEISTLEPAGKFQIPFVIDPWLRFQPVWPSLYSISGNNNNWTISTQDSLKLKVQVFSSSALNVSSFLGPLELMAFPEDPNADYTPGYFLPFSMILLETQQVEKAKFKIDISP
jgi:hypothetical protein